MMFDLIYKSNPESLLKVGIGDSEPAIKREALACEEAGRSIIKEVR